MKANERIVIVGAGVSGLTTAVVLAETEARVHVITDELPGVTSLAAGAIWGPYLVKPEDKVDQWSRHAFDAFRELAVDPATGVQLMNGVEASRHADAPADWAKSLPDFRPAEPAELPEGFISGYHCTAPSDRYAGLP